MQHPGTRQGGTAANASVATKTQNVLTYSNGQWHSRQRNAAPTLSGTGANVSINMPGYSAAPFITFAQQSSHLSIFELSKGLDSDEAAGQSQYIAAVTLANSAPVVVEIKDFGSLCQFTIDVAGKAIMELAGISTSHLSGTTMSTQQRNAPGGLSGSGKVT